MFQHYALFPHMSVADNIAFPLEMRRIPKDKIKERGVGGRHDNEF
jgi:putative spermidine/putrescine transport system ATP-binding protein